MSNRKHRDNQEICARKVRELAQSGVNKHCFECSQPGVTYIDITVGCFVCTSCSGMLRGLNPPHRVKSISMTTFSQQEVEFLQNHGNESDQLDSSLEQGMQFHCPTCLRSGELPHRHVGKRTWLCAFDPKTDGCFDARDAQRLKEFLQDKYEKKKWHISKNKNRREVEGPWSPGAQVLPSPHPATQPASHPHPSVWPTRTLVRGRHGVIDTGNGTESQAQLSSWDRAPSVSPADLRTDVFTARPSRSQSFRDPQIKDSMLGGLERQRPSTVSPGMGPQSHTPSFPALPRPSGRSVSSVGGPAPFRAFPKSMSVDFGGLGQHPETSSTPPVPPSQDRYAALSQLDSVFSDSSGAAPPSGPPQYSAVFGNRVSSSSTPTSSPGLTEPVSSPQSFPTFSNPFTSTASTQPSLSPSNPFNSASTGESSKFVPTTSAVFPQSASFPAPSTQSSFPAPPNGNQEANGFASFSKSESKPRATAPVSVNPFTGTVYPSRGTSRNPFI
ncbi:arf-GAP domain and FG repeat-containing protein 2 isoform X2 [Anguilla anguilla]|uniref:arf-GAP domain and FG repeat-containing protein 2 isoform X2 n=1 Tax=Anguilla anguilla TaxID=7936 RepID=UPI0015B01DF8|nr:arf-GAP domain and FG repeat-containing protein 2 isoform X2 [Anguilla anguilla]